MVDRFARRDQAASTEGVEEHEPARFDLRQACSKSCYKSLEHSALNRQTKRRGDTEDVNPVCDKCYQLLVNAWKQKIRSLNHRVDTRTSDYGMGHVKTIHARDKLEVYTDLRPLELYDLKPGRDDSLASSSHTVSLRGGGSPSVGRGHSSSVGRGRSSSFGRGRSSSVGRGCSSSPPNYRGRSSTPPNNRGRSSTPSNYRGCSPSPSDCRGCSPSPRGYRSPSPCGNRSPSPCGRRPSHLEGFCGDCGKFHDECTCPHSKEGTPFAEALKKVDARHLRAKEALAKLIEELDFTCPPHAKEARTPFAEASKKAEARRLHAKEAREEARAKLIEELISTCQHPTTSAGSGRSESMGPFARYSTQRHSTSAGLGRSETMGPFARYSTQQHSTTGAGSGRSETMGPLARYFTHRRLRTSDGSGRSETMGPFARYSAQQHFTMSAGSEGPFSRTSRRGCGRRVHQRAHNLRREPAQDIRNMGSDRLPARVPGRFETPPYLRSLNTSTRQNSTTSASSGETWNMCNMGSSWRTSTRRHCTTRASSGKSKSNSNGVLPSDLCGLLASGCEFEYNGSVLNARATPSDSDGHDSNDESSESKGKGKGKLKATPTKPAKAGKSTHAMVDDAEDDHVVFGCNLDSDFNFRATPSDSDGQNAKNKGSESKAKATPTKPAKGGKSTHGKSPPFV